jgi:hypothetical protein
MAGTRDRQSYLTARAVSNAIVHADGDRLVFRGRATKDSTTLDCKVEDAAAEVAQRALIEREGAEGRLVRPKRRHIATQPIHRPALPA